ncbi:MAG: CAP domain-containing protein [Schumannella sp.]
MGEAAVEERRHEPQPEPGVPDARGWKRAGENVASGYGYTKVVAAWVASPSHYANLVGDYTSIGIGYYEADGRRYWAQVFGKYPGTKVPAKPSGSTPTPDPHSHDSGELPRRARASRRDPDRPELSVVRDRCRGLVGR